MSVVNVYTGIYRVLSNDDMILNLLGIKGADNLTKRLHIQKRSEPQDLAENLPLIAFYTPGGGDDVLNNLVFNSTFVFDTYTNDDVELAQNIAQRIFKIFSGEIPKFSGVELFEVKYKDGHESASNLPNTYCFTIILIFSYSLEC